MELATLIGLVLAFVGVLGGMVMEGGNPAELFTHPAPILIVVLGSFGATMTSFTLSDCVGMVKVTMRAIVPAKVASPKDTISQLVHFAGRARKDGMLALEGEVKAVEDPFMRKGLQMAVDGADPDVVREVLAAEITSLKARHKVGANFFTTAGIFAPTFGIIGAVLGLIHTLGQLAEPANLGKGIAAAFIATFWGVFSANAIYLPLGNKLKRVSADEVASKELIVEGVMSIMSGHNPRLVGELLSSFVPPSQRPEDVRGG